ncbi:MAG: hypothetical protein EXS37_15295 [Opitutus sp.]|nr:hypothetical protein [Opitutus sp.]
MVSPQSASDAALGSSPTVPQFDDDAWEDLLNYIEEKRGIPIVGPELLRVETDAGPRLLYDWLAEKLAARLNVDPRALPQPYTLNDVVCWFLAARGRREEAYTRLRTILRETNFSVPPALRQLAQITDFDLFITTTFDPLLEQAINAERFAGAASTEVVAYSPNRVADLSVERERQQRPVVYHLLGRLSASPTYVISEEDTLEFVCALQSEHLTPEKLFHELEHNHLLLIGSNFSNWLARLFLRMAKRHRLSDPRDVGEIVADTSSPQDVRLMSFLQQVSVRTRVYNGAEKFVAELHQRWMRRRGGAREERVRRRRRGARVAGRAGRSPAVARGGTSRRAPGGADARRALRRGRREPQFPPRTRGEGNGRAPARGDGGEGGIRPPRFAPRAVCRGGLRGADAGGDRQRDLWLPRPAARAGNTPARGDFPRQSGETRRIFAR